MIAFILTLVFRNPSVVTIVPVGLSRTQAVVRRPNYEGQTMHSEAHRLGYLCAVPLFVNARGYRLEQARHTVAMTFQRGITRGSACLGAYPPLSSGRHSMERSVYIILRGLPKKKNSTSTSRLWNMSKRPFRSSSTAAEQPHRMCSALWRHHSKPLSFVSPANSLFDGTPTVARQEDKRQCDGSLAKEPRHQRPLCAQHYA